MVEKKVLYKTSIANKIIYNKDDNFFLVSSLEHLESFDDFWICHLLLADLCSNCTIWQMRVPHIVLDIKWKLFVIFIIYKKINIIFSFRRQRQKTNFCHASLYFTFYLFFYEFPNHSWKHKPTEKLNLSSLELVAVVETLLKIIV